jgi:hypothetical protein
MRNAYIAAVMAIVLVVAIGGAPAVAQEPHENPTTRAAATPPAERRAPFDVTPGMARMLGEPAPTPQMKLLVPAAGRHTLAYSSKTGRGTSNKVAAAAAFGMAGMLSGVMIGSALNQNCHCSDPGMAGGFLGMLIGTPLGAWFGVWLAGR